MGKTLKCCTQTWRVTFIVLNILFALIGLAMVVVGIWLFVEGNDLAFITDNSRYTSPAALLIVAGIITVVMSIVGIIGAIGMWYCVLIVYISFMVIVVILQIVAGILGAVFTEDLGDIVEDKVMEAMNGYRLNSSNSDENEFIDFIQREFECCGYSGPANWLNTTFYTTDTNNMFPESCECSDSDCTSGNCAPFRMSCNASEIPTEQYIWIDGCNSSVIDKLEENLGIIAGVGVSFGLFELLGVAIGFALCICSCMKRTKDDDYPVDEYVY